MHPDIVLFEDEGYRDLLPLTWTHPAFELASGMLTVLEKVRYDFPDARIHLHTRAYLAEAVRERHGMAVNEPPAFRDTLFLNGRLLPDTSVHALIRRLMREGEFILSRQGIPVAVFLHATRAPAVPVSEGRPLCMEDFPGDILQLSEEIPVLFRYPWDLVCRNPEQLQQDLARVAHAGPVGEHRLPPGVVGLNAGQVYLGARCRIYPGVVLDAEDGPIVLEDEVTVMPGAYLQGPLAIRRGCVIKPHTKVYEGTLLGPVTKAGGEIEASTVLGYSNKQHEGFLGHAYIGMWVNLGAGTNNSDLKNNYSTVRVLMGDRSVDTGLTFWGLIAGDHTKTAIGTQLNTGTILGVSCNVFGAGFPPRYVPSFSWGGAQGLVTYTLPRALEVAARVMGRRNRVLTEAEADVLRYVFSATEAERAVESD